MKLVRKEIVIKIKTGGPSMTYNERQECKWDLFLVHGVIEFCYSVEILLKAIAAMKAQGLDHQNYDVVKRYEQQDNN